MDSPENGQSDAWVFVFISIQTAANKNTIQISQTFTSNRDLKYGLHADKTILWALHVCPSHANVTYEWDKRM